MLYLHCEKTCSKHLCWVTELQPRSCRQGKKDSRAPLSSHTVPASNSKLVKRFPLPRYLVRNWWGGSWEGPQQRHSGMESKCCSAEPVVMPLGTLYPTSAFIARGILWGLGLFKRGAQLFLLKKLLWKDSLTSESEIWSLVWCSFFPCMLTWFLSLHPVKWFISKVVYCQFNKSDLILQVSVLHVQSVFE